MNHTCWDTLYTMYVLETKEIYISVKLAVFIADILSQNKSYTIITGLRPWDSCRGLFKKLKLLTLQSSTYSLFCYSLWTIRIFSMLIQKYTVLVLDKILTFISLRLTYHCIRKGLPIQALKFLIVSPPT